MADSRRHFVRPRGHIACVMSQTPSAHRQERIPHGIGCILRGIAVTVTQDSSTPRIFPPLNLRDASRNRSPKPRVHCRKRLAQVEPKTLLARERHIISRRQRRSEEWMDRDGIDTWRSRLPWLGRGLLRGILCQAKIEKKKA